MNYAFLDTTYRLESHRIGDWSNFQIQLYYYMPPPAPPAPPAPSAPPAVLNTTSTNNLTQNATSNMTTSGNNITNTTTGGGTVPDNEKGDSQYEPTP